MSHADATLALEISESIKPLLAERDPNIQGAVLADLLSLWLAGHYPNGAAFMDDLLERHIALVKELLPVSVRALKDMTR
jgi:hypothetical protein